MTFKTIGNNDDCITEETSLQDSAVLVKYQWAHFAPKYQVLLTSAVLVYPLPFSFWGGFF